MKSRLLTLLFLGQAGLTLAAPLDLSGEWRLLQDPDGKLPLAPPDSTGFKDVVRLPGTLAEAGKGAPLVMTPSVKNREAMRHLQPRFSYLGPAWYRREIDIPADWKGRDAELLLERVMWESRLWVNGEPVGARDSLCTPHRYEIGPRLIPGTRNTLLLRIDNRRLVNIGIGHAYTAETQGFWNGVIGRLELSDHPCARVTSLRVNTAPAADKIAVRVALNNSADGPQPGRLTVRLVSDDRTLAATSRDLTLAPGAGEASVEFPTEGLKRWSEFSPTTMKVVAEFKSPAGDSRAGAPFGIRTLATKGAQILVNGTPVFLRGTLECCIFPRTGHPEMGREGWDKIMGTVRAYGLNHIRFHSWCPPEAAFDAADSHGVYLQVELPNWSSGMGRTPDADAYFQSEGERILREYGGHPSFALFSLGNELGGDFDAMDRLLRGLKALDPDKLMTSTSFSFSPRGAKPGPADDYFITQKSASGWVRGQGFLNTTPPATDTDYAAGVASAGVPLVSHEVGQYVVYPNLAELPKYDGLLRATAWEAIRDDLAAKGRLAEAPRFTRDSGKLAVELYKEDVERALRTPGQAGIQLLDLHDFPGQSTATVGVLDAFWDSKGLVTPEAFRRFAGPVVPLARLQKRVWENSETFRARVDLANFGPDAISRPFVWKLSAPGGVVVASGELHPGTTAAGGRAVLGEIAAPLSGVHRAAKLTLEVALPGTRVANAWDVWVYPTKTEAPAGDTLVTDVWDKRIREALAGGARVVLTPSRAALARPLDARFIPVFWSPLHFANQPGTLGASINPDHPVFGDFPTDTHTQWQWWELFATSFACDLDGVSPKPETPLEFVDKYDRNALPAAIWECRVGKGALLVCTLDIADKPGRIVARQLRRSVLAYAASPAFSPKVTLEPSAVDALFKAPRPEAASPDCAAGHPASKASDGDPATFWHTDWRAGANRLPAALTLDTRAAGAYKAFSYTPRRDMDRGRIGEYRIEASADGIRWRTAANGAFPPGSGTVVVPFAKPVNARYFRLIALTDQGASGNAAVAECEPVPATPDDVRDLGIVEGFNDR